VFAEYSDGEGHGNKIEEKNIAESKPIEKSRKSNLAESKIDRLY